VNELEKNKKQIEGKIAKLEGGYDDKLAKAQEKLKRIRNRKRLRICWIS
jgi:hypothetical protein